MQKDEALSKMSRSDGKGEMAEEEERFVPHTSFPSGLPECSGKGDGCFQRAAARAAAKLPSAAASLCASP